MPNVYVRQIYCFPTSNSDAVEVLSQGLRRLARDVPYILSRLVRDTSGIVVGAPCRDPEDLFSRNDLSDSIRYASLQSAFFPPGAFLAPSISPPEALPPYPASPAVFAARATLVDGGLIVCVAVHHAVTDITGYGALLKIWASHCRDASSSSSQDIGFDASWMNRGPLFSASASLSHSHDPIPMSPLPDLLHIRTPEEEAARSARRSRSAPEEFQTGIFYFPQKRLRALKDVVNAHIALRGANAWVSTGDILSSLLWSAIIEADGAEEAVPDEAARTSTLSFPVQFRSVLRPPLPQGFLGAAFVMTNAKVLHRDVCLISRPSANSNSVAPGQELNAESQAEAETLVDPVDILALANVALAIRWSTQGINGAAVRQVLEYIEAHQGVNPEAPLILGPPRYEAGGSGTSVVSWADQCAYELDWGDDIGRCDAVRLSKMGYERDPIVLPRVPGLNEDDGGLEVIMSYEKETMQRLVESPVMRQLAVLRCVS